MWLKWYDIFKNLSDRQLPALFLYLFHQMMSYFYLKLKFCCTSSWNNAIVYLSNRSGFPLQFSRKHRTISLTFYNESLMETGGRWGWNSTSQISIKPANSPFIVLNIIFVIKFFIVNAMNVNKRLFV